LVTVISLPVAVRGTEPSGDAGGMDGGSRCISIVYADAQSSESQGVIHCPIFRSSALEM